MEQKKIDSAEQDDQPNIEDIFTTVEIFKRALELRPHIREGIVGPKFTALTREERLEVVS